MSSLQLFGTPDVIGPDGERSLSILAQPKRLALLAYLAIATPRGFHTRDALLGLLWPESDTQHARNSLRQSLHFLRRRLGPEALVNRGETDVAIGWPALRCDVVDFERALDEDDAARAVELYRADLLEGFFIPGAAPFEQWLATERARLRRRAVAGAWRLAEKARERSEGEVARRWGRQAVELDPTNEASTRKLIQLLGDLGDGATAVLVYRELADRLVRDYELEPSPETTAAINAVRTRAVSIEPRAARAGASEPVAVDGVPDRPQVSPARASHTRRSLRGLLERLRGPFLPDRVGTGRMRTTFGLALGVLAVSWGLGRVPPLSWGSAPSPVKSIAVLPFRSIGPGADNAFVGDAMHQEILTQLSRVRTLRVITRSSVAGYRIDMEDDRTVAERLGVGFLIRGAIQSEGGRIHIWVRLIDATTDEQLWASSYDGDQEELFGIELQVARHVTNALEVQFPSETWTRSVSPPTTNAEAYEAYLRGRLHASRAVNREDAWAAVTNLEKAVRLDPDFASAQAALSSAKLGLAYVFEEDHQAAGAEAALARAKELAPDDPDTWLAEAYHLSYAAQEYDRALAVLDRVLEARPSQADALALKGFIERRKGMWEEAAATMTAALELDPNSYTTTVVLAEMLMRMGRYERAERLLDRAIVISPRAEPAYVQKALLYLDGRGDMAAARAILEEAPVALSPRSHSLLALIALFRDDYDEALRLLTESPGAGDQPRSADELVLMGLAHLLQGHRDLAVACADSIQRILTEDRRPAELATTVGGAWPLAVAHSYTAVAAALSGRDDEAVAEGERAAALLPMADDAHAGAEILERLAEVYALTGRTREAVATLDRLLAVPSRVTRHVLRMNPVYRALRQDPGFRALVDGGGRPPRLPPPATTPARRASDPLSIPHRRGESRIPLHRADSTLG